MPGTWSEEDDRRLWSQSQQYKTTSQLASSFNKTTGAIRARLKHLQDPTHKAYKRRVGSSGGGSNYVASASQSSASFTAGAGTSSSYFSGSSTTSTPSNGNGVIDLTSGAPPVAKAATSASGVNDTSFASGSMKSQSTSSSASSMLLSSSARKQPSKPRISSSTLNSDQTVASQYIFSGGNAFLTGAAGVGKSYLLNYLIQGLREKYPERVQSYAPTQQKNDTRVVVAAATGIAATHIGGVTIHSWAGVRLGNGGARVLVPRVMQNEAACQRWRKAEVLVLDEVSMIDGMFFEALDAIGREVRGNRSKPFGGIQLVLSGDFFQLPPVSLSRCGFAFESPAWSNAAVKMVELRTVVRQSGDTTFINLLNQVRVGTCTGETTQALEACHVSRKALPTDGIVPTKLYCTNKNVDQENDRNLAALPGRVTVFNSTDKFKGNYNKKTKESISQTMDKKMPSQLKLKVGAQVILTRNMPDKNLVNGSRGVVKSYQEGRSEFDSDEKGYDQFRRYAEKNDTKMYPVVHFSNGVKMLVRDESAFQGGAAGAMTRSQLPLKLAWSLTVHKSQGMTIERAELQLDDAFDYGQVYVALSRITALAGLWVRGGRITQTVVKAHPKVKTFYQQNGSSVSANA